jgi:hypothetical protein
VPEKVRRKGLIHANFTSRRSTKMHFHSKQEKTEDGNSEAGNAQVQERKRDIAKAFLYVHASRELSLHQLSQFALTDSRNGRLDELTKGKLKLEHSLGLGHQPNVIPEGLADIKSRHRTVELGWHPVAGWAGKWFAERTGLGKLITEKIHSYPDPTQHWAILVGDYCHELWMVGGSVSQCRYLHETISG